MVSPLTADQRDTVTRKVAREDGGRRAIKLLCRYYTKPGTTREMIVKTWVDVRRQVRYGTIEVSAELLFCLGIGQLITLPGGLAFCKLAESYFLRATMLNDYTPEMERKYREMLVTALKHRLASQSGSQRDRDCFKQALRRYDTEAQAA